jgi:hypothetical protein
MQKREPDLIFRVYMKTKCYELIMKPEAYISFIIFYLSSMSFVQFTSHFCTQPNHHQDSNMQQLLLLIIGSFLQGSQLAQKTRIRSD